VHLKASLHRNRCPSLSWGPENTQVPESLPADFIIFKIQTDSVGEGTSVKPPTPSEDHHISWLRAMCLSSIFPTGNRSQPPLPFSQQHPMPCVLSSSTAVKNKTWASTAKINMDSLKSLVQKEKKKKGKKKRMETNIKLLLNPLLPIKELRA